LTIAECVSPGVSASGKDGTRSKAVADESRLARQTSVGVALDKKVSQCFRLALRRVDWYPLRARRSCVVEEVPCLKLRETEWNTRLASVISGVHHGLDHLDGVFSGVADSRREESLLNSPVNHWEIWLACGGGGDVFQCSRSGVMEGQIVLFQAGQGAAISFVSVRRVVRIAMWSEPVDMLQGRQEDTSREAGMFVKV
jgi:hypothetical protein